MNHEEDRDPVTDAHDDRYGLVAGLLIVAMVIIMIIARSCGWA